MNRLVSIIIPSYNNAQFIAETLESVFNQTYSDFEIVLVDDGSTDDTKSIVNEYIKRYPRKIRYMYQPNQGISVARNKALKFAKGEYIAFLDSDDVWEADKLKLQMEFFDQNPEADLVYTNSRIVEESNTKTIRAYTDAHYFQIKPSNIFEELLIKNFITFPSIIVKKNVLDSLEKPVFAVWNLSSQDTELLLRISREYNIYGISEYLVRYRLHDNNTSKDLVGRHSSIIAIIEKYIVLYPDVIERLGGRLTRKFVCHFFDYGYALFERDQFMEAREQFYRSIKKMPFFLMRKYVYFLLTFFPESFIDALRKIKRSIGSGQLGVNT